MLDRLARAWRRAGRARRLTARQWGDLIRAAAALYRARIVFGRLGPRDLVAQLQEDAPDSPKVLDAEARAIISRLDESITRASGMLPWRTDCLIRCLAAHELLRTHGLSAEFRIGIARERNGQFKAHAWTLSGGLPVAGGDGSGFAELITPETKIAAGRE